MGIYRLNENLSARLKALQLYIYWGALKAVSYTHLDVYKRQVYVNIQNLKTWKHNTGYTPELGGTATAFGVDNGSYPVPAAVSYTHLMHQAVVTSVITHLASLDYYTPE